MTSEISAQIQMRDRSATAAPCQPRDGVPVAIAENPTNLCLTCVEALVKG